MIWHKAVSVELDLIAQPGMVSAFVILDRLWGKAALAKPFKIGVICVGKKYLSFIDAAIVNVIETLGLVDLYDVSAGHVESLAEARRDS